MSALILVGEYSSAASSGGDFVPSLAGDGEAFFDYGRLLFIIRIFMLTCCILNVSIEPS